jgi:hypothetical protein
MTFPNWAHYSGFQAFHHTAPSLRLFVPNSLKVYHCSFSSEGCACNVFFFQRFLLLGFFRVAVITLQPLTLLAPYARSSQVVPDKSPVNSLSSGGGRCFYITGSSSMCSFSFRFGGGRRLHKVQSLILFILLEIPSARFTNSSPKAFL